MSILRRTHPSPHQRRRGHDHERLQPPPRRCGPALRLRLALLRHGRRLLSRFLLRKLAPSQATEHEMGCPAQARVPRPGSARAGKQPAGHPLGTCAKTAAPDASLGTQCIIPRAARVAGERLPACPPGKAEREGPQPHRPDDELTFSKGELSCRFGRPFSSRSVCFCR